MSSNAFNTKDELSKVDLSLYENSIKLWRVEEKCKLKLKSIENIENSTKQSILENKWLENQLKDAKLRIEEVKEFIVSMDRIILSHYETLAYLEVEYKKKEFSINKSKNDFELQLFVRMELMQKEEERLDNMPEVKSLKVADMELNNTKLEYEDLLNCKKNLIEKIKKAEELNNERKNNFVVEFAKAYTEMLNLNKREENCINLLRKLKNEYNEKLLIKNELLESHKKKVNKTTFWTQALYPFDSKMIDIKLDLLCSNMQELENKEVLRSENKPKKNVTFLLSSEDQTSNANNDISYKSKSINTNLVEYNLTNNDTDSNSSFLKDNPVLNKDITSQEYPKQLCIEPSNINFNDNLKITNESDCNFHTNKRQIIDVNSDIVFKKPYNPAQKNQTSSAKNESIQVENNVIERNEKNQSQNSFSNNHKHEDIFCLENVVHLQKKNSLNSAEQLNVFDEATFEPNTAFSGLYWNDDGDHAFQNSNNSSFCGSDLSELFGNSYGISISQYPEVQLNFSKSFNSNSNVSSESNSLGMNMNYLQQSGNSGFQPHNYDPFKKVVSSNGSVNETSNTSSFSTEPILPHFATTEKYRQFYM